ncbi:hypothetical protein DSAG12_00300 [Promethearchaeum syntrophicum]|uniref:GIY-YIG domain-containing protein n=1 Tax=Promethearchaeum syntrophicum TaxID=2594042 RepID=A0A5B9D6R8_9ARCH|nr:hypothetical protein [Candidatus Prometheoarchaeum syntrophicum]QEE14487.1 hypothetical protein DSAG12_00300 [Candidatus Prometheoarchaeum syntrophicum]
MTNLNIIKIYYLFVFNSNLDKLFILVIIFSSLVLSKSIWRENNRVKKPTAYSDLHDFCQDHGKKLHKILDRFDNIKMKYFIGRILPKRFFPACKEKVILFLRMIIYNFPGIVVSPTILSLFYRKTHVNENGTEKKYQANYNKDLPNENLKIRKVKGGYIYDENFCPDEINDDFNYTVKVFKGSIKKIIFKGFNLWFFPERSFDKLDKKVFQFPSVYYKICNHKESGIDGFYVGRSEKSRIRFRDHINLKNGKSKNGKYANIKFMAISSSDWAVDDVINLESVLVDNGMMSFPTNCFNNNKVTLKRNAQFLKRKSEISEILSVLNDVVFFKYQLRFKISKGETE